MAGISSILAELDRMKRQIGRRNTDMVSNPAAYFEQMTDNMRNSQKGREAVSAGGSLGYRDIPREEQVSRMTEGALDTVGGGVGSLLGKGARFFNQPAAKKAQTLAMKGATAEDIWHDVPRNWVLPSGNVLQEISDAGAKINAPWLPDMTKLKATAKEAEDAFAWAKMRRDEGAMPQPEFEQYLMRRLKAQNDLQTPPRQAQMNRPLSQFLDHPELFANYPELAKIDLAVNPHTKGAFQDPSKGLISIGTKDAENAQSLLPVTVHEGNHGIQTIEGLPAGGGPEMFASIMGEKAQLKNRLLSGAAGDELEKARLRMGELKKHPAYGASSEYDAYRRLMGEQLAEVSQFRANRGEDWLTQNFPGHELTVPVEDTIWRSTNTGAMYPSPMKLDTLGGYGGQRRWHGANPAPEQWDEIWRDYYMGGK